MSEYSRKQKRYLNRKNKRELKRREFLKKYDNFQLITNYVNLLKALNQAAHHVSWKVSVQHYITHPLSKIDRIQKNLINKKPIHKGFIKFDCKERGKVRHIQAVHFSERIVQKCLCKQVLYPVYTHFLIKDNYANQIGKGLSFARKRFENFIHQFYKKYGKEGYILFIDFKSYFPSINHNILKQQYRRFFTDSDLLYLIDYLVDTYGENGLGLGSETCQLHGILYARNLDDFIKCNLSIKYYGRYMDDSFIICENKEKLLNIRDKIYKKAEELKLNINKKKTIIKDLKHGFSFLKTRYFITDTGKLVKRPTQYAITKEKRKLRKLIKNKKLTNKQILESFISWKGSVQTRMCRRILYKMKKDLYITLRTRYYDI